MQEQKPFWYRMIYYWCRRMNRYGLTIPFIIGVQSIEEIEQLPEYKTDIDTLIKDVTRYEAKDTVILQYCYDLEAFVLGLDNEYYPLEQYVKKTGNLLIHDDISDKFSSLDDFTAFIKKDYENILTNKHFSRNKKQQEWQIYNPEDIADIKKFLARQT